MMMKKKLNGMRDVFSLVVGHPPTAWDSDKLSSTSSSLGDELEKARTPSAYIRACT